MIRLSLSLALEGFMSLDLEISEEKSHQTAILISYSIHEHEGLDFTSDRVLDHDRMMYMRDGVSRAADLIIHGCILLSISINLACSGWSAGPQLFPGQCKCPKSVA